MNARMIILVLCSSPWSEQKEYQRRVWSSSPRWAPGKLRESVAGIYFLSTSQDRSKNSPLVRPSVLSWLSYGLAYFKTSLILFCRMYLEESCEKYRLPQAHAFGGSRQHRTQLVRHRGLPKSWKNLSCNCETWDSLSIRNKDLVKVCPSEYNTKYCLLSNFPQNQSCKKRID